MCSEVSDQSHKLKNVFDWKGNSTCMMYPHFKIVSNELCT